jgi:hypothetical protein
MLSNFTLSIVFPFLYLYPPTLKQCLLGFIMFAVFPYVCLDICQPSSPLSIFPTFPLPSSSDAPRQFPFTFMPHYHHHHHHSLIFLSDSKEPIHVTIYDNYFQNYLRILKYQAISLKLCLLVS